VHQDGANWDFLLIQPLHNTPEQNKAWSAAATRLGIPHGGYFFWPFGGLLPSTRTPPSPDPPLPANG
jgi:hypothetical protein